MFTKTEKILIKFIDVGEHIFPNIPQNMLTTPMKEMQMSFSRLSILGFIICKEEYIKTRTSWHCRAPLSRLCCAQLAPYKKGPICSVFGADKQNWGKFSSVSGIYKPGVTNYPVVPVFLINQSIN